jgi:hypothetical protein
MIGSRRRTALRNDGRSMFLESAMRPRCAPLPAEAFE